MTPVAPERPVVCVGAVVVGADGILLIKRNQPPLLGEWTLPGGRVELGETLAAAIAREVQEEAGIEIRVGPIIEVLDRLHHDAQGRLEFHYVLIDFACVPVTTALAAASDAAAARWVAAEELSALGVRADAVDVIAKGIALTGGLA